MAINTKDHVSLPLQKYQLYGYILYPTSPQKYYAIYKRPSQLLAFSVSFILFSNPHIAMRNLALFKKPAL